VVKHQHAVFAELNSGKNYFSSFAPPMSIRRSKGTVSQPVKITDNRKGKGEEVAARKSE
jgi:hypothetical protein